MRSAVRVGVSADYDGLKRAQASTYGTVSPVRSSVPQLLTPFPMRRESCRDVAAPLIRFSPRHRSTELSRRKHSAGLCSEVRQNPVGSNHRWMRASIREQDAVWECCLMDQPTTAIPR